MKSFLRFYSKNMWISNKIHYFYTPVRFWLLFCCRCERVWPPSTTLCNRCGFINHLTACHIPTPQAIVKRSSLSSHHRHFSSPSFHLLDNDDEERKKKGPYEYRRRNFPKLNFLYSIVIGMLLYEFLAFVKFTYASSICLPVLLLLLLCCCHCYGSGKRQIRN